MSDHVFVRWTDYEMVLDHWEYVGNGETRPIMKQQRKEVVLHFSSVVNTEMVQKAKEYAKEKRKTYSGVAVYVTDWESRHNV